MSHTPGPWSRNWIYAALRHINKNVDYDCFFLDVDEEYKAVKEETLHTPNVRINQGDADLIAAAPDLLKACEELIAYTKCRESSTYTDIMNGLVDAIAKARGEPLICHRSGDSSERATSLFPPVH